jgi:hypothetical protein
MRAWFDLYPGKPLTDSDLRVLTKHEYQIRCCRRVLQILCYPYGDWNGDFWFKTGAARQACESLLDASESWAGTTDWRHLAERMQLRIPGAENVLDVEATLLRLGEAHDFGPGPNGKIVPQQSRLIKRIARKIVTYLIARAAPVPIHELADAISAGQVPFEVFLRPSVSPTWLNEYVIKSSELLIQLEDKRIALAPVLAANKPTGIVGILYSIVSRHGEPIRMQDLCDKASVYGIGRNQTGMLIHSHRAACLFMLTRGIVGLVGRDEAANPSEYEAANPWCDRKRVRPGHEIGCAEDGALVADIQVRRSIREQGLGLPWPFSLVLLDGSSHILLDDDRIALTRRPNGDLDLPQLAPGDVVRLTLRRIRNSSILSISTQTQAQITPIRLGKAGAAFPLALLPSRGRPGWVTEFENRHDGTYFIDLDTVFSALPSALSQRRRVYALHAFVALGIVRHTSRRWKVAAGQPLPPAIASAFQLASDDSRAYTALPEADRAAVAWLVRAAWLTPNLGWSIVRHNDLSQDTELDPLLSDTGVPSSIGTREAALMRVVETAHQAADRLEHPGNLDLLDETGIIARRYLTALGYTSYHGVRELVRVGSWASIAYAHSSDAKPTGVWVLKPVGVAIEEADTVRAVQEAKKVGSRSWAVTNGLRLKGSQESEAFDIDLRAVGRIEESYEQLIRLAAEPADFVNSEGYLRNGDNAE